MCETDDSILYQNDFPLKMKNKNVRIFSAYFFSEMTVMCNVSAMFAALKRGTSSWSRKRNQSEVGKRKMV